MKRIIEDSPSVSMLLPFMGNPEQNPTERFNEYINTYSEAMPFTYVNITTKGCEGWLNLFFQDIIIACISDVAFAAQIRQFTNEKI